MTVVRVTPVVFVPELLTVTLVACASVTVPAVTPSRLTVKARVAAAAVIVAPRAVSFKERVVNASETTATLAVFPIKDTEANLSAVVAAEPLSVIVVAAAFVAVTDVTLDFVSIVTASVVPLVTVTDVKPTAAWTSAVIASESFLITRFSTFLIVAAGNV